MPRARLDDARSRLLEAGLVLFARYGTERVNTNKIARRAGLGVGTFYTHFPDKYALLREIETRTLTGLGRVRLDALREPDSPARPAADPTPLLRERTQRWIEAAVRFAERHPEAYRVTFGRERTGAAHHGPIVSESSRPTARELRRLQHAGHLPPDLDVELAARAYLAMETGMILWWLEDTARASPESLVTTLTRLHPVVSNGRPRKTTRVV